MKKTCTIILLLFTILLSCKKNSENASSPAPTDCSGIDSRFAARVLPIIQASCATNIGCHGNGSTNGPGVLASYSQISNAASSIKAAVSSGEMPRGGTLNAQDKNA